MASGKTYFEVHMWTFVHGQLHLNQTWRTLKVHSHLLGFIRTDLSKTEGETPFPKQSVVLWFFKWSKCNLLNLRHEHLPISITGSLWKISLGEWCCNILIHKLMSPVGSAWAENWGPVSSGFTHVCVGLWSYQQHLGFFRYIVPPIPPGSLAIPACPSQPLLWTWGQLSQIPCLGNVPQIPETSAKFLEKILWLSL